jgi:hypothetical protein
MFYYKLVYRYDELDRRHALELEGYSSEARQLQRKLKNIIKTLELVSGR